jgi:hypothetical protein
MIMSSASDAVADVGIGDGRGEERGAGAQKDQIKHGGSPAANIGTRAYKFDGVRKVLIGLREA